MIAAYDVSADKLYGHVIVPLSLGPSLAPSSRAKCA
jgi:hypothetical protein